MRSYSKETTLAITLTHMIFLALSLSAIPSVTPDAKLTGHLIPKLQVGISAFNSQANANIFLNLNASISADLSMTLQDAVTVSIDTTATNPDHLLIEPLLLQMLSELM